MELLKKLSGVCAPSGREATLAQLIEKEIGAYCDSVSYDKAGNLIAVVKPQTEAPRVMLCAHMDECGFMVKHIDNDGRVRIALLGKVDTRTLSGRRVRFLNGTVGIVAAKPIHALSAGEAEKPTPVDKLYIELGAKDRSHAQTMVQVGDFGTFEPKFTALAGETYAGKALGGRACVAALIQSLKAAKAEKEKGTLSAETIFVFSVKREIAGAMFAVEAAAFHIRPDRAIVLDAAPAWDFGGTIGSKCGDGIVIAPADSRTIYDRELFGKAISHCGSETILYQYPRTAAGAGGEGGSIHKCAEGVRTLSIGIPTRNLHSGAEIIRKSDFDAMCAFLKASICADLS